MTDTQDTTIPGVRLNPRLPKPKETCAEFLGIHESRLPYSEAQIVDSVIGESHRLAMTSLDSNKDAYPKAHILYLRNWALEKARGFLSGDMDNIEEYTMARLNGGLNPSLALLGEFIELPNGYYVRSQTRLIPIADNICALISGQPTRCFCSHGVEPHLHGVVRWIVGENIVDSLSVKWPAQSISNYLGRNSLAQSPESYFGSRITNMPRSPWTSRLGVEYYEGSVAGRFDFHWGSSPFGVDTEFGRVMIARVVREHLKYDYYFRIDSRSGAVRVDIDYRDLRRILLAYDALAKRPRSACVSRSGEHLHVGLDFPPPTAERRHVYILGASGEGFRAFRLRWSFPSSVDNQVLDLLRGMWLKIET